MKAELFRRCAVVVFAILLIGAPGPAVFGGSQVSEFERWGRSRALPLQTVEPSTDVTDLHRARAMFGDARVVSLGEPAHGAHEPLAFRNRLFAYLVEHLGFTAIALESGLPESRRVFDYVAGGRGDAAQVVRENLTWGFGNLQENEQLVSWIRNYNADPTHHRKVHVYGIDLSVSSTDASISTFALEQALSYLSRVDSTLARRSRVTLKRYIRPAGSSSAPLSTADHDSLNAAIDALVGLLARGRATFVARTSLEDYAWALRSAVTAQQAERMFRLMPPAGPRSGISPAGWRASSARDSAMAENVQWVLTQEGPDGRVLVFAHNGHVKNAGTKGGIWSVFEQPANSMGQYLRRALGSSLLIVGTASGTIGGGLPAAATDSAGVDAALARVGLAHFLLDLRPGRRNPSVAPWLAAERPLRANFTTVQLLSIGAAFDVMFFVDTLTPAHRRSSIR